MAQIIKFKRNNAAIISRDSALLQLNNVVFNAGEPVIALYKDTSESTEIKCLYAIGTENGKGKYKLYSSQDDVNTINTWINNVINGAKVKLDVATGNLILGGNLTSSGISTLGDLTVATGISTRGGVSGADKYFATNGTIGTIPTSLPANGGNADFASNAGKFNNKSDGEFAQSITINGTTKDISNGTVDLGTYDNYNNWKFTVDGNNSQTINSGNIVNFVGGQNVTITNTATNTIQISSTDTDTWRPVIDNLTSTDAESALSANQGKVLKTLVDSKPSATGVGASGTWGINITGNASTASSVNWDGVQNKPSTFVPSAHKHAPTDITGLTNNTVAVSNGTGNLSSSNVTTTELGYLSGVKSSIQTQIDGKAALNGSTSQNFSVNALTVVGSSNLKALTATSATISSGLSVTGTTSVADLTVRGNLSVEGDLTTVKGTEVVTDDNIIKLNAGETANGTTRRFNGLLVDRGKSGTTPNNPYAIVYDGTDNVLKIGEGFGAESGTTFGQNLQIVATRDASLTDGSFVYWDNTDKTFKTKALPSTIQYANNGLKAVSLNGNGTCTFTLYDNSTITGSTSHTHANYVSDVTMSGTGNALTSASINGNTITFTKATYDNYSSWSYKVNGVVGDSVNSGGSVDFINGNNVTISRPTANTIKIDSTYVNTATAASNILLGSNSGTQITYAPYTSQQARLSFDTSSTNPTRTDRLNLNGHFYATKLNIADTTDASSTAIASGVFAGGLGVGKQLMVGSNTTIGGITTINSSAPSTATNSGALVVSGGVGIGGALRVGGTIYGNLIGNVTGSATSLADGSVVDGGTY